MRVQYFKRRHWKDFFKKTQDIGGPLFWLKYREDDCFLYRLYNIQQFEFASFYQHHLKNFLQKYSDAEEMEFFNHVWELTHEAVFELKEINSSNNSDATDLKIADHLQVFLTYLKTIDRWNVNLRKMQKSWQKTG